MHIIQVNSDMFLDRNFGRELASLQAQGCLTTGNLPGWGWSAGEPSLSNSSVALGGMRPTLWGQGDLVHHIQDLTGQIKTGLLHAGIAERLGLCSQRRSGFCEYSLCLYSFDITYAAFMSMYDVGLAFVNMLACPRHEWGSLRDSLFAHSCVPLPPDVAFIVGLSSMCIQVDHSQTISTFRLGHSRCVVYFMSWLPSAGAKLTSKLEESDPHPVRWWWSVLPTRLKLSQGSTECPTVWIAEVIATLDWLNFTQLCPLGGCYDHLRRSEHFHIGNWVPNVEQPQQTSWSPQLWMAIIHATHMGCQTSIHLVKLLAMRRYVDYDENSRKRYVKAKCDSDS